MSFLTSLLNALPGAVAQGLIWGIMAIGVYITYRILDVADLTVDGSLATGGAVCVMLIRAGVSPWPALLCAMLAGMLAGLVTGLFHTKCGIPAILAAIITQLKDFENTGKTVAFFFVNSDGSIVIRKPTDYIPKMIELAGGRYAFENFVTDQTNTSVSVTMETFYGTAVDADVLIYNASIDAPISSINELLAKDALFADFKAVLPPSRKAKRS